MRISQLEGDKKTVLSDLGKHGHSLLTGINEQLVPLEGRQSFLEVFSDLQGRLCERTGYQIDVPSPARYGGESGSCEFPQERCPQRTVAEIVEIRGPQIQEQVAEAFKVIPQERVSERVVVPQILEQSVEVMTVAGAECRNA